MPRIKQIVKIGDGIGIELEMPVENQGCITIYDAAELKEFEDRIDAGARREGFLAGQRLMQSDCESAALAQGFKLTKVPIRDIQSSSTALSVTKE